MGRIAIVSQSYYPVIGGVTEHVHYQAAELLRRGHEVTILTGPRPDEVGTLFRGNPPRFDPETEFFGSERVHEFESAGGRVLRIGRTRRVLWNGRTVTTVGEPGLGRELSRIDPYEFDVVHVHAPFEPFLPYAAVQYFRSPIVGTFHTTGTRRGLRILRPWLGPIARRLDVRIAVSAAARDFVGPDYPGDYRIIPNGIDPGRFMPCSAERISNKLRVLSVGRLDPRKGVDVLLRALSLHPNPGQFQVRVAGTGPEQKALEEQARRANLSVEFLGVVSEAELIGIFSWADLFVAPATFGESFGIVLLEAMAAGLPILASDIEGYRELTEGCGGVERAGPHDAADWCARLNNLRENPGRRSRMGRANVQFARGFSWSTIVDQLEDIYEEVRLRVLPAVKTVGASRADSTS